MSAPAAAPASDAVIALSLGLVKHPDLSSSAELKAEFLALLARVYRESGKSAEDIARASRHAGKNTISSSTVHNYAGYNAYRAFPAHAGKVQTYLVLCGCSPEQVRVALGRYRQIKDRLAAERRGPVETGKRGEAWADLGSGETIRAAEDPVSPPESPTVTAGQRASLPVAAVPGAARAVSVPAEAVSAARQAVSAPVRRARWRGSVVTIGIGVLLVAVVAGVHLAPEWVRARAEALPLGYWPIVVAALAVLMIKGVLPAREPMPSWDLVRRWLGLLASIEVSVVLGWFATTGPNQPRTVGGWVMALTLLYLVVWSGIDVRGFGQLLARVRGLAVVCVLLCLGIGDLVIGVLAIARFPLPGAVCMGLVVVTVVLHVVATAAQALHDQFSDSMSGQERATGPVDVGLLATGLAEVHGAPDAETAPQRPVDWNGTGRTRRGWSRWPARPRPAAVRARTRRWGRRRTTVPDASTQIHTPTAITDVDTEPVPTVSRARTRQSRRDARGTVWRPVHQPYLRRSGALDDAGPETDQLPGSTPAGLALTRVRQMAEPGHQNPLRFTSGAQFVSAAYGFTGVTLPALASELAFTGTPVHAAADLEPGDVLIDPDLLDAGLYAGNGAMFTWAEGRVMEMECSGNWYARRINRPVETLARAPRLRWGSSSARALIDAATPAATSMRSRPRPRPYRSQRLARGPVQPSSTHEPRRAGSRRLAAAPNRWNTALASARRLGRALIRRAAPNPQPPSPEPRTALADGRRMGTAAAVTRTGGISSGVTSVGSQDSSARTRHRRRPRHSTPTSACDAAELDQQVSVPDLLARHKVSGTEGTGAWFESRIPSSSADLPPWSARRRHPAQTDHLW